ncbi:MAG: ABC transporter permease subunit [Dehalococcoidia bacterium]
MTQPPEPAGSIYDLGYRRYEGARLGRRHAIETLYLHSLRASFGLGRRASSKIIPIGLCGLALVPAAVQLGIAAVSSRSDIEIVRPEEYYDFIQLILALFVAAVAPELVGRDQRTRTLSLYFSRTLLRPDYALAKLAALTTAMTLLTAVPLLVLFVGDTLVAGSAWEHIKDNWQDVPRIAVSGVAVSFVFASIALAIAAQTARRSYSTGGIIAFFVITAAVGNIVAATSGKFGLLLSVFDTTHGATLWFFGAQPDSADPLSEISYFGPICTLTLAAISAAASALLVRRFRRVSA